MAGKVTGRPSRSSSPDGYQVRGRGTPAASASSFVSLLSSEKRATVHGSRPAFVGDHVAGEPGRAGVAVDDHGGNAAPAQGPNRRQAAEVAAQDDGAGPPAAACVHDGDAVAGIAGS